MFGSTQTRRRSTRTIVWMVMGAALVGYGHGQARLPGVTGMRIQGGRRGLALALTADVSFERDAAVERKATRNGTLILLHVPRCSYGLSKGHFNGLGATWPFAELSVKERVDEQSVDIMIRARTAPDRDMDLKRKGNSILLLISSKPQPDFTWRFPRQEKDSEKAVATCMEDVRVVYRGTVGRLVFEFDEPFEYRCRREDRRMTILFARATNCLPRNLLMPLAGPVFRTIELKHHVHNGTEWLGAIVALDPDHHSSFYVSKTGLRLTVTARASTGPLFAAWSAASPLHVERRTVAEVPPQEESRPRSPERRPRVASRKPGPRRGGVGTIMPLGAVAVAVGERGSEGDLQGADPAAAAAPSTPDPAESDSVWYRRFGADPFVPYVQSQRPALPSLEHLTLVGILYDDQDRLALLQDRRNSSTAYSLREKDRIENGSVLRINPNQVVFLITEFGISRTHTMELRNEKATAPN